MQFVFKIEPVAKGRPRFSAQLSGTKIRTTTRTPAKTRDFERSIQLMAKSQMRGADPLTGPLEVVVCFMVKKPAKPKHPHRPIVRPDLDNYFKAVIDALNGIAYKDDSQICCLAASKHYAGYGRESLIEIRITELKDEHEPTNESPIKGTSKVPRD